METRVYFMDMTLPAGLTAAQALSTARRLSLPRREKIGKFKYEQDKLLCLGAGLLLEYGLKRYGLTEREAAFSYGEHGKPYLADHPGIRFNLSHSGNMVMAAFSGSEVGCDIERQTPARLDVAERFFAKKEFTALKNAASDKERDMMFGRLWVLKESFLKATGEGVSLPMDSFCFSPGDRTVVELSETAVERTGKGGDSYRFKEYALPGYYAAVCLDAGTGDAERTVFCSFQNLQDMV